MPVEIAEAKEFTRSYNKAVGSVVSAICRDRDLKQEDTARLLRVSTRQVRRLESGQAPYTVVQLELIARKTETTTIDILKAINNFPQAGQSARKRKNSK